MHIDEDTALIKQMLYAAESEPQNGELTLMVVSGTTITRFDVTDSPFLHVYIYETGLEQLISSDIPINKKIAERLKFLIDCALKENKNNA